MKLKGQVLCVGADLVSARPPRIRPPRCVGADLVSARLDPCADNENRPCGARRANTRFAPTDDDARIRNVAGEHQVRPYAIRGFVCPWGGPRVRPPHGTYRTRGQRKSRLSVRLAHRRTQGPRLRMLDVNP